MFKVTEIELAAKNLASLYNISIERATELLTEYSMIGAMIVLTQENRNKA